jgi:hypothetical protein
MTTSDKILIGVLVATGVSVVVYSVMRKRSGPVAPGYTPSAQNTPATNALKLLEDLITSDPKTGPASDTRDIGLKQQGEYYTLTQSTLHER